MAEAKLNSCESHDASVSYIRISTKFELFPEDSRMTAK